MVSAGGAAGGVFVALLAPRWFRGFLEFPLGLVLCGALTLALSGPRRATCALATIVVAAVAAIGTFYVGHSGGELVYKYGAASAYAPDPSGMPPDMRKQ